MTPEWLERSFITGPHLCLCLSPEAFVAAFKHIEIDQLAADWIRNEHSDATAHLASTPDGKQTCVVCVRVKPERTLIEIHGLLVHEAVHIFQEWCERVGERFPSDEFQAYSIQSIAQNLMWSYEQQTSPVTTADPKLLY